jgi:hypothetical protein
MSYAAKFRRALNALFDRRTHWLRKAVEAPRRGRAPELSRAHVMGTIEALQDLTTSARAKRYWREELRRSLEERRSWHAKRGKGRGPRAKKEAFNAWYRESLPPGPCVYVFWIGRKCEYVGKAGGGGARPQAHFMKYWFQYVTRIDIYVLRGRRALPVLECLAIHHFGPRQNMVKAERRAHARKCKLCLAHSMIRSEVGTLFRLQTPKARRRRRRR